MDKSRSRIRTFNLWILMSLFLGAGCQQPLQDPDFWWHLQTGRWIWQHNAVPHTDPFSFTAAGRPWIAHEWLWEYISFGLWQAAGPQAIILARGLVLALTAGFLFKACNQRTRNEALALGAAALGVLAFSPSWSERPQLVTHLFIAFFTLELDRFRRSPSPRIWALAAVIPLWVNLHAGYFFGLALIAYYTVTAGSARRRQFVPLLSLFLVSVALAVLNPNGIHALTYPFWYLGHPVALTYVQEWQSPDFHTPGTLWFVLFLLTAITAFALSPKRFELFDIALFALLLRQALYSARNIALLGLVGAPVMGEALEGSLGQRLQEDVGQPSPVVRWGLVTVALAYLLIALPLPIYHRRLVAPTPYDNAIAYLGTHRLGANLWIPYGAGGAAIWRLWPRYRVFIDGRADIYGDRIFQDGLRIARAGLGWDRDLDRHRVQTVLCDRDGSLAQALQTSPKWKKAYADSKAGVFSRAREPSPIGHMDGPTPYGHVPQPNAPQQAFHAVSYRGVGRGLVFE